MIDWVYIKAAGVVMVVLVLSRVYDLLVPINLRPFPCEECQDWRPYCAKTCGPMQRYMKIKRRKAAVRDFVVSLRGRLRAICER